MPHTAGAKTGLYKKQTWEDGAQIVPQETKSITLTEMS